MTNRPDATQPCAVHPHGGRRALPGFRVCEPCMREGRQALDDIERIAFTIWNDPDALLPKRGSDVARGSSSYKSASPANDLVLALTDWRSIAERRGDPDAFADVVFFWSERVCELTGLYYPAPPPGKWPSIMVLGRMWHWVCKQDFAGLCVWDMTNTANSLREVAHENRGKAKLGRCPVPLDGLRCGYLLLVRPDADHVTCPRCTTRWARDRWIDLSDWIAEADGRERRR
ncbi:hypothetical protein Lesp02_84170 [Lentzea sp. NBRC 105346]|uniref:hypothetical protein n=1 Tax=Lentzea sp. NBRC 105346 TaxID=3032205 RepID=UPI0024A1E024|nr:hypothetical protein [Lentzea sp. NBRC 105346]GLZ36230.1 hypothetical protein Lesp02_84170 [Lentzea sp. NBRC 105346]